MNRRGFFGALAGLASIPLLKWLPRRKCKLGTRWVHYHGHYTPISKEELVAQLEKAYAHTTFYPPLESV